jgi:hypothetical protein
LEHNPKSLMNIYFPLFVTPDTLCRDPLQSGLCSA